jgi:hypothetical protein
MSWKLKSVKRSPNPNKKWRATFVDGEKEKHTDFGQAGAPDFTLTKDEARRDAYRSRHAKDLQTGDHTRAGFLSYYILWNLPTITASIADYRRRFG